MPYKNYNRDAEFDPDDQSAFNMGLAILFRIDKVLTEIAVSKLNADIKGWYAGLFALKGEIYYKLKEEEMKQLDDLFEKLAPILVDYNRKAKLGMAFPSPQLTKLMEEIETQMKIYMDVRGMLGVTKKDPRYALTSGM